MHLKILCVVERKTKKRLFIFNIIKCTVFLSVTVEVDEFSFLLAVDALFFSAATALLAFNLQFVLDGGINIAINKTVERRLAEYYEAIVSNFRHVYVPFPWCVLKTSCTSCLCYKDVHKLLSIFTAMCFLAKV